ncbi:MAG TPA: glycosyltransferase family 39 protein, partial [Rhizomicrobium sp.]
RVAGLIGLYVLAQACIVTALWAVFTLGRAVVGTRHAALGILLMVGIASFTVPSPEFSPAVLAAPFWALALLHYWRAVGMNQRGAWFLLALDLGLLWLTTYLGVILLALLVVFTLATARGRRALAHSEPWLAFLLFVIVAAPHALWLYATRDLVLAAFHESIVAGGGLSPAIGLTTALIASHLGVILLAVLASGLKKQRRERAPEIDRPPAQSLARHYVYFFALAPAVCAVALSAAAGTQWPLGAFGSLAPLVLLSGLAVIVAAGDRVLLYRERLVSSAWLALLVAPPVLAALSLFIVPWAFGRDLRVAQPAHAEAQFLAESYQRRTGKPPVFISGDERLAPTIALMTPNRPRVFFAWAPQRSPWISVDDVAAQGGVLVWPAETSGKAPEPLTIQFPTLVPEFPRTFPRAVEGRLAPVRLGWSVLRPAQ